MTHLNFPSLKESLSFRWEILLPAIGNKTRASKTAKTCGYNLISDGEIRHLPLRNRHPLKSLLRKTDWSWR